MKQQKSSFSWFFQKLKRKFSGNTYCVYIACNKEKSKLITGYTASIYQELERWSRGDYNAVDFAGKKIQCTCLLYYKAFSGKRRALTKAHEISKWTMEKKINFIKEKNPEWQFLNEQLLKLT